MEELPVQYVTMELTSRRRVLLSVQVVGKGKPQQHKEVWILQFVVKYPL